MSTTTGLVIPEQDWLMMTVYINTWALDADMVTTAILLAICKKQ